MYMTLHRKKRQFFSFLANTQTTTTYFEAEKVTQTGMSSDVFYVELWDL